MATNAVDLFFASMGETELRQWVETNPGRINDRDSKGDTPLIAAAFRDLINAALVLWLVNEKGADVNATDGAGYTPLHRVRSVDALSLLLDCVAGPPCEHLVALTRSRFIWLVSIMMWEPVCCKTRASKPSSMKKKVEALQLFILPAITWTSQKFLPSSSSSSELART